MNDWAVLWAMLAVVFALWWIGIRARTLHRRHRMQAEWDARVRGGNSPRVVP